MERHRDNNMAGLPPDGEWLVHYQELVDQVVIFHRYTEEEIVRYNNNPADSAEAQLVIHETDKLTAEQKCFAHYWCGYLAGSTDQFRFLRGNNA